MDPTGDEWTRVLKTLAGHALCERCLANNTGLALATVKDILRRVEALMVIEAVQRCEDCRTNVNVYAFLHQPPRHRRRRSD